MFVSISTFFSSRVKKKLRDVYQDNDLRLYAFFLNSLKQIIFSVPKKKSNFSKTKLVFLPRLHPSCCKPLLYLFDNHQHHHHFPFIVSSLVSLKYRQKFLAYDIILFFFSTFLYQINYLGDLIRELFSPLF